MKRHAPKTSKNTEALSHTLWRRWVNHNPCWKPARMKSAKGKTGFTRQEVESIAQQGMVGSIESVRFIESPLAA